VSIKDRLAKLEAAVPTTREPTIIFFTTAGYSADDVTGFQYQDLTIRRLPSEIYTEFEARAISWLVDIGYGGIAFMRSIYT
jgi:hypothetical protein